MSNLSKRLQSIITKELKNNILPIKTEAGILVGSVLISSRDSIKDIYQNNDLVYPEVHLNCAAIAIANLLAKNQYVDASVIYSADKEYSRLFFKSQLLRTQYEKSINTNDYFKADFLWAKYTELKHKTEIAKKKVEALTKNV